MTSVLLGSVFLCAMLSNTAAAVEIHLVTDISEQRGVVANGPSGEPAMTPDGNILVFSSKAANLVSGDANGVQDIFVHEWKTGHVERLVIAVPGLDLLGHASNPKVSDDGRYFVFNQFGSIGGAYPRDYVVWHDRIEDQSVLITPSPDFADATAISGDGLWVAFRSSNETFVGEPAPSHAQMVLCEIMTMQCHVASRTHAGQFATRYSREPAVSRDGRYVAYLSVDENLVVGDENNATDVFVYDRESDSVEIASVSSAGEQALTPSSQPSISGDGRKVAFVSSSAALSPDAVEGTSQVFVRDLSLAQTRLITPAAAGGAPDASCDLAKIAPDGASIVFGCALPGGQRRQFYRHFLNTGATITLDSGVATTPAVANDKYSAFVRLEYVVDVEANGLNDVYIHDSTTSEVILGSRSSVPQQTGSTRRGVGAKVSDKGSVIFLSNDSQLSPAPADHSLFTAYLWTEGQDLLQLSTDSAGYPLEAANANISRDGQFAVFVASGSALVIVDLARAERFSIPIPDTGDDVLPVFSPDGSSLVFSANSDRLIPVDVNNVADIFLYDLATETVELISESDGIQGNASSRAPDITADNQLVAFLSASRTLASVETNGVMQPLIKDRSTGSVELLPFGGAGVPLSEHVTDISISDSGRWVAILTSAKTVTGVDTFLPQVYLMDRTTGSVDWVSNFGSVGPLFCIGVEVSADGSSVFMECNGEADVKGSRFHQGVRVYRYDTDTGMVGHALSGDGMLLGNFGASGFSSSGNGRFEVATHYATNVVPGIGEPIGQILRFDYGDADIIFGDGFEKSY